MTSSLSSFYEKNLGQIILSKNIITYLDNVFMQSQTQQVTLKVIDKYHQTLLRENLKAAPGNSYFFLNCVNFLGHIIKSTQITHSK